MAPPVEPQRDVGRPLPPPPPRLAVPAPQGRSDHLHQVGVLGSVLRIADVQEWAATPTLMAAGVPASPHRVAVLAPRPAEQQIVAGQLAE